jgi:superfamily II DNA/RNA helicase
LTAWQHSTNLDSSTPKKKRSLKEMLKQPLVTALKPTYSVEIDKIDVIVATLSFGMGIDNHKVRFVVHHDLPTSLAAYVQESGRAGRDGLPARCILYCSTDEVNRVRFQSSGDMAESVWMGFEG